MNTLAHLERSVADTLMRSVYPLCPGLKGTWPEHKFVTRPVARPPKTNKDLKKVGAPAAASCKLHARYAPSLNPVALRQNLLKTNLACKSRASQNFGKRSALRLGHALLIVLEAAMKAVTCKRPRKPALGAHKSAQISCEPKALLGIGSRA